MSGQTVGKIRAARLKRLLLESSTYSYVGTIVGRIRTSADMVVGRSRRVLEKSTIFPRGLSAVEKYRPG
jgi:hypothetical protein